MLTSNDTKIYAVNTEKYKENKSTGCVATRGTEEPEEPKNQAGLQSGGLGAGGGRCTRGPLGRCSSPTNDRAGPVALGSDWLLPDEAQDFVQWLRGLSLPTPPFVNQEHGASPSLIWINLMGP